MSDNIIVYKTTNKVNGKFYYGVHKCADLDKFDGYFGSGALLKKAIEKYGKNNFQRETIHVCSSYEEAYLKEQELVNLHLIESDLCYNLRLGGDGGTTQNQEVRKKFSLTRRGKFTKQDNHFYGKKHSDETKKKMSDRAKTRTGSLNSNYKGGPKPNKFSSEKERQLAQSEFMKKANPMHSEEIRKKHSESMKNKPRITCPHCAKNMDMGGYAVHKTALLRKGIVI